MTIIYDFQLKRTKELGPSACRLGQRFGSGALCVVVVVYIQVFICCNQRLKIEQQRRREKSWGEWSRRRRTLGWRSAWHARALGISLGFEARARARAIQSRCGRIYRVFAFSRREKKTQLVPHIFQRPNDLSLSGCLRQSLYFSSSPRNDRRMSPIRRIILLFAFQNENPRTRKCIKRHSLLWGEEVSDICRVARPTSRPETRKRRNNYNILYIKYFAIYIQITNTKHLFKQIEDRIQSRKRHCAITH